MNIPLSQEQNPAITMQDDSQLITFEVPSVDEIAFGALPPDIRQEVDILRGIMRTIWNGREKPGVNPTCRDQAASFRGKRGWTWRSLRRKYYAFLHEGWKALVDWSRAGGRSPENRLKPEFINWFIALAESNQRKTRPAWREFKRQWREGRNITGLDNSLPRHTLPRGCTYANLNRYCDDKWAQEAMRIGLGRARNRGPMVLTSRVGLWPMSHLMIDDLLHDEFVVFRGKPVRVLEFDALELLSGCKIAWGTKPKFLREEDGKFDGLKETFMRMILARIFCVDGFSPRGTTILAERGTAAVPGWLADLLRERSKGKITVREAGITGAEQAVAGMARGRGGGNPRWKGPLEALRNLIHNELASLPATTGKDVEHRPERLHGELTLATDLLKAVAVIAEKRPDLAAAIRLPALEYHAQFLPILANVYATINRRDWHELEGWSKCGFVAIDWRMSPDTDAWIKPADFLRLPENTQAMLKEAARNDERYLRQRKLSPWEVWTAGRKTLTRLPDYVVGEILGEEFHVERPAKNFYFEFQDSELDPEPLQYEARVTTPDGQERELKDDTYVTVVNPMDLERLYVFDGQKRPLGVARRVQNPSKADQEAVNRELGRQQKRLADRLAPVRKRHAQLTRQAAADAKHNADVIEASGVIAPENIPAPDCTDELLERSAGVTQEEW